MSVGMRCVEACINKEGWRASRDAVRAEMAWVDVAIAMLKATTQYRTKVNETGTPR